MGNYVKGNSYYNENTVLYLNGEILRAADAKTDLYSQSLHYGYAVFEGIRSYRTARGETRIFKAEEHYERLRRSAELVHLPYGFSTEALIEATYEVLKQNNLQDAYIRPLVFAPANMSFNPNTASNITIQAWEMQPFLGDKLLRVMSSSYQRPNPKGFHIEAKASGHYVNSLLASHEAKAKGYDEALLCDMNGWVAEGPGANIFYEKDGQLFTPSAGNILPGITRATVLTYALPKAFPLPKNGQRRAERSGCRFLLRYGRRSDRLQKPRRYDLPPAVERITEPSHPANLQSVGNRKYCRNH
ncbi:MAG: aminotransferase class IV [Flavihumibacter sp.]